MTFDEEKKIFDLLLFYKRNGTEVYLKLNSGIEVTGKVIEVSFIFNKQGVIKINEKSYMKIHFADINSRSIIPKDLLKQKDLNSSASLNKKEEIEDINKKMEVKGGLEK